MLFVCDTAKDRVEVFDTVTLSKVGQVSFSKEHEAPIGPRAGLCFNGSIVIAGCYDNTLSAICPKTFKEKKTVKVGAYPVCLVQGRDSLFTVCGDSNSVWIADKNLDISYVEGTVSFPYYMAVGDRDLCICGFTYGEVCIYDTEARQKKEEFTIEGYPVSAAYAGKRLMIAFNNELGGYVYSNKEKSRWGSRIGKMVCHDNRVYVCVDENILRITDYEFNITNEIFISDGIADFVVSDKGIFVSEFLSGRITKFSLNGKKSGRINTSHFGGALILA